MNGRILGALELRFCVGGDINWHFFLLLFFFSFFSSPFSLRDQVCFEFWLIFWFSFFLGAQLQGLCSKVSYSLFFPPFFSFYPTDLARSIPSEKSNPPPPSPGAKGTAGKKFPDKNKGGSGSVFFLVLWCFSFCVFHSSTPSFFCIHDFHVSVVSSIQNRRV